MDLGGQLRVSVIDQKELYQHPSTNTYWVPTAYGALWGLLVGKASEAAALVDLQVEWEADIYSLK